MDSLVLDKGFRGLTMELMDNKGKLAPSPCGSGLGCFMAGTDAKEDSNPK